MAAKLRPRVMLPPSCRARPPARMNPPAGGFSGLLGAGPARVFVEELRRLVKRVALGGPRSATELDIVGRAPSGTKSDHPPPPEVGSVSVQPGDGGRRINSCMPEPRRTYRRSHATS